jgi:hypothetical protein
MARLDNKGATDEERDPGGKSHKVFPLYKMKFGFGRRGQRAPNSQKGSAGSEHNPDRADSGESRIMLMVTRKILNDNEP